MKQQQQDQQSDHKSYDLHSLHKSSTSKIMKMKSLSSLTPPLSSSGAPQPKVYKVKPIHFRELVQKLTGAQPEHPQPFNKSQTRTQTQTQARPNYRHRSNNLQSIAPPPLPLLHQPHQLQLQNQASSMSENMHGPCKVEKEEKMFSDNSKVQSSGVGTTELILSPNFQAWFSFAMLSPGPATISQMDQRSLL